VRKLVWLIPLAVGAAACSSSGGSAGGSLSAPQLLAKSKAALDQSSAVHFELTSKGVSGSGLELTGGSGDIVRNPSSIQGSFEVTTSGVQVSIKVAAVGSTFEAQLPFTSGYTKTDPAKFGLTNPADLLNTQNGLSSLLAEAQNPALGPQQRINGEVLDEVSFTVPGKSVPVIPDSAPSQPVQLTVGINPSNYQLRTVTLVGPFTSSTSNSTFTVTLTRYNEQVTVTLPPAS
jgi:hypothetical protein